MSEQAKTNQSVKHIPIGLDKAQVQVFDPPMCCSTGVCGPQVDPTLARFAADVAWLQNQGVHVRRYNLAREPIAFTQHPQVKRVIEAVKDEGLPVVIVNDHIVCQGKYPTRVQLAELLHLGSPIEGGPKKELSL